MTNTLNVPEFEQLHLVSDLHLGGLKGFQIFNQGELLTKFIKKLEIPEAPAKPTCLVLNGDIVDFLADKDPRYFDPEGAIDKLESIYNDDAFKTVWKALEVFVKRPNACLALILGNHDVELALPSVSYRLIEKLTGGDAGARGRIIIKNDGTGFRCAVGGKQVLCVHGNEVDNWNVVDHSALLQVARSINHGDVPADWSPNAGTRLVIDVMNDIKKDYPMVDLLKPEIEAVVPIVLALEPDKAKFMPKILKMAGVAGSLLKNKFQMFFGFLSAQDNDKSMPSDNDIMEQFLGEHFGYSGPSNIGGKDVADMLMEAHNAAESGHDPKGDESMFNEAEFLGARDFFNSEFFKKDKEERLRLKLKDKLKDNTDFELDKEDDTFKKLDKLVSRDIDYLIAGHTHLRKAIKRSINSFYFNSGSWARLIQLTDDVLDNPADFKIAYNAFKNSSIEALDNAPGLGPTKSKLVLQKPTVVSIFIKGKKTYGELREPNKDGKLEACKDKGKIVKF